MKLTKVHKKLHKVGQGEKAIKGTTHRKYVGGVGKKNNWEFIGLLQFAHLVKMGLRPNHTFVDVACGSLRAGLHFIPYLDKGNYLGIEKEITLVDAGIEHEIGHKVNGEKSPEFVISSDFEFEKFSKKADFGIAQSLFTHLPYSMVDDCLKKLFPHMNSGGKFYGTYFISKKVIDNPDKPHDRLGYWFTKEQAIEVGTKNGWKVNFIGEWGHPRGQQIVEYIKE